MNGKVDQSGDVQKNTEEFVKSLEGGLRQNFEQFQEEHQNTEIITRNADGQIVPTATSLKDLFRRSWVLFGPTLLTALSQSYNGVIDPQVAQNLILQLIDSF